MSIVPIPMTPTGDVFCRYCQAAEGAPCRNQRGEPVRRFHSDRVRLARTGPDLRGDCDTCAGPAIHYPGYGWVHLLDGNPVFPACNGGGPDPTGHTPYVTRA